MNIRMNVFLCLRKRPTRPSRISRLKEARIFSNALLALLLALSSFAAGHGGGGGAPPGGGAPRGGGMAPRPALSPSSPALTPTGPAIAERPSHGTIRHLDTHAIQRPIPIRPEPQHRGEAAREFAPRHDGGFVHRDVDAGIRRHHGFDDFRYHRHFRVLPFGFLTLAVGGVSFCYYDGIYYQPGGDGYDEVYPPVGAIIPEPPDGAIAIDAGGVTYYFAGGAFYLQQPVGTYAIVPAPMGVIVPELPPGAVQVIVSGNTAYQFSNVYYEPVFVNGVTQYQTFVPAG